MSKHDLAHWRHTLSAEQFHICWEKGTEPPYSGPLLHQDQHGDYRCACCKQALFHSDTKFDSGCGWPAFDQAIEGAVNDTEDNSHGMQRTEITCNHCGAHLGHLFSDGPTDTGLRYCMNSLSLDFTPTP
ncbi:MAG: peptide-methionine (R)-S-oxide reductase MsrB [Aeromonas sp.]